LDLSSDILVSKFAFKFNVYRYIEVQEGDLLLVDTSAWWGCTSPRIQLTHSLKGAWFQPFKL
jgi:hypothetical protein